MVSNAVRTFSGSPWMMASAATMVSFTRTMMFTICWITGTTTFSACHLRTSAASWMTGASASMIFTTNGEMASTRSAKMSFSGSSALKTPMKASMSGGSTGSSALTMAFTTGMSAATTFSTFATI